MSQLHHYIPINSFTHGHLCLHCFILVPISLFTFGHFMCQLCHYIPINSFTCGHLRLNCFVLVPIISFIRMCHHIPIVSLSTHRFVHTRMCHVSSTFNRCSLFESHMPRHLLSKFASLGSPLLHSHLIFSCFNCFTKCPPLCSHVDTSLGTHCSTHIWTFHVSIVSLGVPISLFFSHMDMATRHVSITLFHAHHSIHKWTFLIHSLFCLMFITLFKNGQFMISLLCFGAPSSICT
jgi:hypothetical protein